MAQSLAHVAIKQLSVSERLDIISILWDSIPDSLGALPTPESRREELERRLARPQTLIRMRRFRGRTSGSPGGRSKRKELRLSELFA